MKTWITGIPFPSAPSGELLAELRTLEGERVDLTLRDGSRVQGYELVSAGRLRAKSVWVLRDDVDFFIRIVDISAVQAAPDPDHDMALTATPHDPSAARPPDSDRRRGSGSVMA